MKPNRAAEPENMRSSGAVDNKRDLMKAGLAALAVANVVPEHAFAASGPWSTKQFLDQLNADKIERVVFTADGKQIRAVDTDGDSHAVLILPEQAVEITKALQNKNIPFNVQQSANNGGAPDGGSLINIIANFAPLLLLGGLFLASRNRGGSGGPMGGMGGMGGGNP